MSKPPSQSLYPDSGSSHRIHLAHKTTVLRSRNPWSTRPQPRLLAGLVETIGAKGVTNECSKNSAFEANGRQGCDIARLIEYGRIDLDLLVVGACILDD